MGHGRRRCRKRRHATELDAKIALLATGLKRGFGDDTRRECRYYHCAACRAWHLTSMPLNEWKKTA